MNGQCYWMHVLKFYGWIIFQKHIQRKNISRILRREEKKEVSNIDIQFASCIHIQ